MGHVDHGKTKLLDYIRKTNIVDKEAGGITQSIGAYEIEHKGKQITFIDTPGHEAFSSMRQRGAHIADLAILVVAADEGVKPQTKEAVSHIQSAGIPFVVAINKIDKPNADIARTKASLSEMGVYLEGAGGNISSQEISAKTGQGIAELLDLIALATELETPTFDPGADGSGVIIEAHTDASRGNTVTAIIEDGIVREGDEIATPTATGRVRIMEDFRGRHISSGRPSTPILVVGFETLPLVGEEFVVGGTPQKPKDERALLIDPESLVAGAEKGREVLNVIVRGDVMGSVEALSQLLSRIEKEHMKVRVIDGATGNITEGDINLAIATKALIAGFNVEAERAARQHAKNNGVTLLTSKVIYELLQLVEKEIEQKIPKPPVGKIKIAAIFRKIENRQVIGGKVSEGFIKNGSTVEIHRGEKKSGAGKIVNLQSQKRDADRIDAGNECGILLESPAQVREGDELWYFEQ